MDYGSEFEVKILMWNNIGRYGGWGVCFTYAVWFALLGLAAVEKTYSNRKTVRKGVDFLLSKQKTNGGWGVFTEAIPRSQDTFLKQIQSQ